MLELTGLRLPYTATEEELKQRAAELCRVSADVFLTFRISRRALDARKKQQISYLYNVTVSLPKKLEQQALRRKDDRIKACSPETDTEIAEGTEDCRGRIVVAGLGPAGLFAAYTLAKQGYRPLVLERGRPVEERVQSVERFWSARVLDPESNVMFGEGGAGTFSDGKLTSRSKDPRGQRVLELLAENGAPGEIVYLAKPHIGTDRLRAVVSNLRRRIEQLGGEVWFSARLSGVRCDAGRIAEIAVTRPDGEVRVPTAALVLATGLGARDTCRMLHRAGVAMQPKAFAVGCRIEHPQSLIDHAQFGDAAGDPRLGAAEYHLSARSGDRGVYTFCMCPGGKVVASASAPEQLVVNGMSDYARDAENANAAVIVQVGPEDFGYGAFDGVRFCEKLERDAFYVGGGDHTAPASRVEDYLARRASAAFSYVHPSYRPGVRRTNLWDCLPEFVAAGIAEGVVAFGRQLAGYDLPDAVLTAVESRTSSPIRILRTAMGVSETVSNLYPAGEGAGYAGGIVSAAIDGMRAAERIIGRFRPPVWE